MKKEKTEHNQDEQEMLTEYDLTGNKGLRRKYHRAYRKGHTLRIREADKTVSIHYFTVEDGKP